MSERTHGKSIMADYKRRGLTVGVGGDVMKMRNVEKMERHKEQRRVRREAHESAIAAFKALPVAEQVRRLERGGAKEQRRAALLRRKVA
jgi:hypothetical protein